MIVTSVSFGRAIRLVSFLRKIRHAIVVVSRIEGLSSFDLQRWFSTAGFSTSYSMKLGTGLDLCWS